MKILSHLIVLLLIVQVVSADGGGWWWSYGKDEFSPLSQSKQICSIDYKDGTESMLISIRAKLEGEKVVWIFPVSVTPEKTEIDIVKEFPEYGGYDVKSKAGYTIHEANFPMIISQVWSSPFIIFWQMGIFSAGRGGIGTEKDLGVKIHEHIEKMGLTTELVTSENEEELNNYLQDKGLNLPEESLSVIKEYIGMEYSFVVSWVSDVERYKKEIKGDILAVKIKFPTKRIYYPLRLTSIYGEKRIPIVIYVNGYVSPEFYENIKDTSKVNYYANDKGLKYTKININTRSKSFTEDLWIDNKAPVDILIADFITTNSILSMIVLFALYSCLASIISGLIVFRRDVVVEKLALLGLTNFLTVIGFAIAVMLSIKTKDEDKEFVKKFLMILIATLLFPFLIIPLAIFIPILGILALFAFIFGYPLLCLGIAILMINKFKKKGVYVVLFSILFLIITIFSNLILVAAFPPKIHGRGYYNRCSGFAKIRCLDPSIQFSSDEGELRATFINGAGTTITITNINATGDCVHDGDTSLFRATSINVGETVEFVCSGDDLSYKNVGDTFRTDVSITYIESIAGTTITHTERGTIRGIVD